MTLPSLRISPDAQIHSMIHTGVPTKMTRVFPYEQWASQTSSEEESNISTSHNMPYNTHNHKPSATSFPFRRRLQSLPLDSEITDGVGEMCLGHSGPPEDGKKHGGIRGLFRKASISLKNRQRRHSHAVEDRPQTAWNKLRSAASFQRHSKFLPAHFDTEGPFDSHEELLSPIPGNGSAPPIIPHGFGGAAARATAAAQNEYFGRNRQLLLAEDQLGDRESGIGIAVTNADPVEYAQAVVISDISRVDFISRIPAELGIQILSHLDQETLRNASKVSRHWAQISKSQHVWREVFMREQTKTYATSKPVALGSGLGLPEFKTDTDWKDLYRIREQLHQNWKKGYAEAIYLNGHLDSIYCVQFDE